MQDSQQRLRVIGATASPYTRKMVALLRYRHIPHNMIWKDPTIALDEMGIKKPKPVFLPTFLFEDDTGHISAECDSTPIIRRLEENYRGRSVLPSDPALAFIDYLLEDFGDEWCTKYMFHYRWHFSTDADNAGTLLPFGSDVSMDEALHQQAKESFSARQIGRLYVVGSNDQTAGVIDASYRRLLAALEEHLSVQRFLLGGRPGAGDFAIFGQLTQLVGFDPTPRAIAHEVSPRTVAWVDQMEDQSGLEPEGSDWMNLESVSDSLRNLLKEVGRVYAPAQLANVRAVQAGDKTWETEIDGALWTQQTFPYQAKCLKWTNEKYAALDSSQRQRVDQLLEGTGCETMLSVI